MALIEDRFTEGGVDHAGSQPPLDLPRCCAEAVDEVRAAFWSFSTGAGMGRPHFRDRYGNDLYAGRRRSPDAPAA